VRHTGWSDWLRRNAQVLGRVKAAVERNGPMGNADFDGRRPPGGGGWWSWRPVQHALHYLWMTGALTVHSRWHFQKRFDLLERAGRAPAPSHGTTLLSPFDSLLWHRGRAARVFGFDYRIEVYTPGPKRVHGYYVLPILHHGHLIGRLDAKAHRGERRLEVRHVHFEPWFASAQVSPAGWGRVDQDEALA